MSRVGVVVPAGGSGQRMGGAFKPLLELGGAPILSRSIEPLLERGDVVAVAVALPAALAADPPAWLLTDPRVCVVAGGAERGESVRNALRALPADVDVVLVHDAVRPLVTAAVIDRCVAAAAAGRSVIAAVAVTDTIQEVAEDGTIVATPFRSRLRAAQTPQAFPAHVLRAAYDSAAAAGFGATDDAAVVVRHGVPVGVVDGAPDNIKITSPGDLDTAELLLARRRGER